MPSAAPVRTEHSGASGCAVRARLCLAILTDSIFDLARSRATHLAYCLMQALIPISSCIALQRFAIPQPELLIAREEIGFVLQSQALTTFVLRFFNFFGAAGAIWSLGIARPELRHGQRQPPIWTKIVLGGCPKSPFGRWAVVLGTARLASQQRQIVTDPAEFPQAAASHLQPTSGS